MPHSITWSRCAGLLFSLLLLTSITQADQLELIQDINQQPLPAADSNPAQYVKAGEQIFFLAESTSAGRELWVMDRQALVPRQVRDIAPGMTSAFLSEWDRLHVVGNRVVFVASEDPFRSGLWVSDGTATGTLKLDVFGDQSSLGGINVYAVIDDILYFEPEITNYYGQIWRTDGTAEGTYQVTDPNEKIRVSMARGVRLGDTTYFPHFDEAHGMELWRKVDNAPAELFKEFAPGTDPGLEEWAVSSFNGGVLINNYGGYGPNELWFIADGVTQPLLLTTTCAVSGNTVVVGSQLFFPCQDDTFGNELWRTDGTQAGTRMVKELNLSGSAFPYGEIERYVILGDVLMFEPDDGIHFSSVYRTDGTAAGTYQVTATDGQQQLFIMGGYKGTAVNGKAFLGTEEVQESGRVALYGSDGTSAGTSLIWRSGPGVGPYGAELMGSAVIGDQLLVFADRLGATGGGLMLSTGGSAETTSVLANVGLHWYNHRSQLLTLGDKLVFTGISEAHGSEPWVSDGSVSGTRMLANIALDGGSAASSAPNRFVKFADWLYFVADDGLNGRSLWRTKGTAATTELAIDLIPGVDHAYVRDIRVWKDALYISFDNSEWDATAGSIVRMDAAGIVTTLHTSTGSACSTSLYPVADILMFCGYSAESGAELWRTDGTTSGTYQVKDIVLGTASGNPYSVDTGSYKPVLDGALYFTVQMPDQRRELWKSDGTEAGTVMVKDLGSWGYATRFVPFQSALYFTAYTSGQGMELWRTDGTDTGTYQVIDIAPGAVSSSPGNLRVFGNALYFFATDEAHGTELWRSDGTADGTQLLKDVRNGTESALDISASWVIQLADKLLLLLDDGQHGLEWWISDGTAEGTRLLTDIMPGASSSEIRVAGILGQTVYFSAKSGDSEQLWSTDGTAVGTRQLTTNLPPQISKGIAYGAALTDTILVFAADTESAGNELWRLAKQSLAAPTITAVSDITLTLGQTPSPINLQLSDADTPAELLTLTTQSSNTGLLPLANINLSGLGAQRTLSLQPVANQTGNSTITISVSDGTHTSTTQFKLTVNAAPSEGGSGGSSGGGGGGGSSALISVLLLMTAGYRRRSAFRKHTR